MILSLESGRNIRNVTEADILANIVYGETFAILLCNDDTYMHCAQQQVAPYDYVLEYQEGSVEQHYEAVDGPITLERVRSAFLKYLRDDPSWRLDFRWEKMQPGQPISAGIGTLVGALAGAALSGAVGAMLGVLLSDLQAAMSVPIRGIIFGVAIGLLVGALAGWRVAVKKGTFVCPPGRHEEV
jgi:hypothetical protein